ncbi:hypothetical protein BLS_005165 [Venturia inaequalis]|nr:hypothetical protein BLS_005165 [Venturia inaequalis]RDI79533.1 hypothetical protein Vi05172_g10367 [Venturia inaequalis]
MGSKRHQDGRLRTAIRANKKNNGAARKQEEENGKFLMVRALTLAAVMAMVAFCVAIGGGVALLFIAVIFFGLFVYAVWAKAGAGGNAEGD